MRRRRILCNVALHVPLHVVPATRQDHCQHRHSAELGPAQACAPAARPAPPRRARPRRPGRDTAGPCRGVSLPCHRRRPDGHGGGQRRTGGEFLWRNFREEQGQVPRGRVRAAGRWAQAEGSRRSPRPAVPVPRGGSAAEAGSRAGPPRYRGSMVPPPPPGGQWYGPVVRRRAGRGARRPREDGGGRARGARGRQRHGRAVAGAAGQRPALLRAGLGRAALGECRRDAGLGAAPARAAVLASAAPQRLGQGKNLN